MIATFGLAFLAGLLSILSPCVLPLVPLVLGAALSRHRFGAAALAAGLALSFSAIGLFVATIGYALDIDGGVFRNAAAIVMVVVGAALIVPALQVRFATAAGPVGHWAEARFGGDGGAGWAGQFGVGLLLGFIWSPCVGPTLGAASLLAAQGRDLASVALTMALFGIGAAVPMLLIGSLSRHTMTRLRGRLLSTGKFLKHGLGALLVIFGVLTLSGLDRTLETALVDASPAWLTAASTRF